MKTGFWGITPELDTLMENRVFEKNTVDVVIQDCAVILDEETKSMLYREPDVSRFRFNAYTQQRKIRAALGASLVEDGMDEIKKSIKLLSIHRNWQKYSPYRMKRMTLHILLQMLIFGAERKRC